MIVFAEDQIDTPEFKNLVDEAMFGNMSVLARRSMLTGKEHIAFFNVDSYTWTNAMQLRKKGALIQDSHHFLDVDEREFIISGITPEEWESSFGRNEHPLAGQIPYN